MPLAQVPEKSSYL